MKRIVLTGGGTAGHVTPNMALVPSLKEAGYDIQYIGSYNGIEKRLIEEMGSAAWKRLASGGVAFFGVGTIKGRSSDRRGRALRGRSAQGRFGDIPSCLLRSPRRAKDRSR